MALRMFLPGSGSVSGLPDVFFIWPTRSFCTRWLRMSFPPCASPLRAFEECRHVRVPPLRVRSRWLPWPTCGSGCAAAGWALPLVRLRRILRLSVSSSTRPCCAAAVLSRCRFSGLFLHLGLHALVLRGPAVLCCGGRRPGERAQEVSNRGRFCLLLLWPLAILSASVGRRVRFRFGGRVVAVRRADASSAKSTGFLNLLAPSQRVPLCPGRRDPGRGNGVGIVAQTAPRTDAAGSLRSWSSRLGCASVRETGASGCVGGRDRVVDLRAPLSSRPSSRYWCARTRRLSNEAACGAIRVAAASGGGAAPSPRRM